jgi:hypothetical protein
MTIKEKVLKYANERAFRMVAIDAAHSGELRYKDVHLKRITNLMPNKEQEVKGGDTSKAT